METSKVFIYCRVLSEEARSLLEYQEGVLREYADMLDIEVFAVAREIGSGKHFGSRGILIHPSIQICAKQILISLQLRIVGGVLFL